MINKQKPSRRQRDTHEQAITMRLARAEALIRQDQPQLAWDELGAEPEADLPLRLRMTWYWLAGWALMLDGRHEEATRFLKRGVSLADLLHGEPQDQQVQLVQLVEWLHCFLGVAYCAQDLTLLALQEYRRGLLAIEERKITDPELILFIYKGLGREYLTLGLSREAIVYYKLAVKKAADLNNTRQLILAYWGLGVAYQESGHLDDAWMIYQDALQIVGCEENWHLVAQIRGLLGKVLTKLKYYDEAEKYLRKSLAGAELLSDSYTARHVMLALAELYLAQGKPEEAIQMVNQGIVYARQKNDWLTEGQLYLTLAQAHVAHHATAAAEQAIKQAITILESLEVPIALRQAHEYYARFLAEQGRFQHAYNEMALACAKLAC